MDAQYVEVGSSSGKIDVYWELPTIPFHGAHCAGTYAEPAICPTPFGGSMAETTGGTPITGYYIQWNEAADFSGAGSFATWGSNSYTIEFLTPGKMYYVRVAATNGQGRGPFCAYTGANCRDTSPAMAVAAAA